MFQLSTKAVFPTKLCRVSVAASASPLVTDRGGKWEGGQVAISPAKEATWARDQADLRSSRDKLLRVFRQEVLYSSAASDLVVPRPDLAVQPRA